MVWYGPDLEEFMYSFVVSTLTVASAELGDKTQLLALLLASRFQKPIPIILGIIVATLLNHAGAGFLGEWIGTQLSSNLLHIILAIAFLVAGIWILVPDQIDDNLSVTNRFGIFITTFITFFIAEIGDKTQIATMMLAAEYQALMLVVLGTTAGMLLVNLPTVFIGEKIATALPLKPIRMVSSGIFIALALMELMRSIN